MAIRQNSIRKIRLTLEKLTDRLTPAFTWVGVAGSGTENWTNEACWDSGDGTPGDDGYPGAPGQTGEWAKFDTLAPNRRLPTINTNISIYVLEVTSNWQWDIEVDGTLTFEVGLMTGSGALTGDGTVTFGTLPAGPIPLNHSVSGIFDVKTKSVKVLDKLNFEGGGQVGYDAGAGGSWLVDTPGHMILSGNHPLGSDVTVKGTFVTSGSTSSLSHVGEADSSLYNLKTFSVEGGTLSVSYSFGLSGTRFKQTSGFTKVWQNSSFSVGDNSTYADGGTTPTKTVDVLGGKFEMYPQCRFSTAKGDMSFSDGVHLDIYCPGYWEVGGMGYSGWVEVTAGGEWYRVDILGSGTKVNFKDYTPSGATFVSQGAVQFINYGSLLLGSGLVINQRLQDNFLVNWDCTIQGANLVISGTPPSGGLHYNWTVIWCESGTLGGVFGTISSPPTGWEWVPGSPEYGTYELSIAWAEID